VAHRADLTRGGPLRSRVCRLAPGAFRSLGSGLGRMALRSARAVMVLPVLEILGIGLLLFFLGH
jgi:hypothetical protein